MIFPKTACSMTLPCATPAPTVRYANMTFDRDAEAIDLGKTVVDRKSVV